MAAATLVFTALAPGAPRTAHLLAAQPSVAGQTVAGEGGGAGAVLTLLAQRNTVSPSLGVLLGEPLATTLHWGRVQGRISVWSCFSREEIYKLILSTDHPPKVVLVIFSTVVTGFKRFFVTTRWKG